LVENVLDHGDAVRRRGRDLHDGTVFVAKVDLERAVAAVVDADPRDVARSFYKRRQASEHRNRDHERGHDGEYACYAANFDRRRAEEY
jgi:hypothetical protein